MGKINIGETVHEQLKLDLELEKRAIPVLNEGIELCRSEGDNGTADLLEDVLEDEEEHANWLEAQLTMIEQVGLPNYLAEQMIEKDE
jgi:bacterioferritin